MKRSTGQAQTEASRGQVVKRSRTSVATSRPATTSSSLSTPNTQLTGHTGPIYSCRFSTSGGHAASASFDRTILLWDVFASDNSAELRGHKNAVLDVRWSADDRTVYSASADSTIASWDARSGTRLRQHRGHDGVVNAIDVHRRGTETIVSAGDDATIGLWDTRTKSAIDHMTTDYSVTAVAISTNGSQIFSGGVDDEIKVWDVRKRQIVYTMAGHDGTITSLEVSPDGSRLLSNGTDDRLRIWNIQPFAPEDRQMATLEGAPHGDEQHLLKSAWSGDGKFVVSGSADRQVCLWEAETGRLVYRLPGHKGTVTCVDMHPTQPIVLSGSIDRTMFLGGLS